MHNISKQWLTNGQKYVVSVLYLNSQPTTTLTTTCYKNQNNFCLKCHFIGKLELKVNKLNAQAQFFKRSRLIFSPNFGKVEKIERFCIL